MPCNCDHLEPTQKEKLLRKAARLQLLVRARLKMSVPAWLRREEKNIYASDERCETELCAILTGLSKEDRDRLLYSDARDSKMRDVADWWEAHETADKARRKREREEKKTEATKKEALGKLTEKEKKALGLK